MNYTSADIKQVRDAIAAAVPDAYFEEGDYGFTLRVANPGRTNGWTLFETVCSPLDEDGSAGPDTRVVRLVRTTVEDVPRIVEWLRQ